MSYKQVWEILQDPSREYPWPPWVLPAPEATDEALKTKTVEEVVQTLEDHCWRNAVGMADRYPNQPLHEKYLAYRHAKLKLKEFWEYDTALALGLFVEPPEDKIGEAVTVSEWLAHHERNRDRKGYVLFEDGNEASMKTKARRKTDAETIPLEWSLAGENARLIWKLAVIEGLIRREHEPFMVTQPITNPALDDIRGLDAQQWLDNLRCQDQRTFPKWLPNGEMNPEWASLWFKAKR